MSQLEVAHHERLDPNSLLLASPRARLSIPIRVTASVLDLTNPDIQSELKVTDADLRCETEAWKKAQTTGDLLAPQCIGLAVAGVDAFDGILFPSALSDNVLEPLHADGILPAQPNNLVLVMNDTKTHLPRGKYSLLEPAGAPLA